MSKRTLNNNRYELEDLPVTRGGMGEIWFGRDINLDREVAVKVVRFPDDAYDEDLVRRFVRESKVMARLAHPGVPAVYDVGVTDDRRPYLVMQRIHGISVKDLVAEQGSLPIGWATAMGAQICSVLAAAHEASLVHRDLKPGNVMLDADGAVTVLDFGLAAGVNVADFSKITSTGVPIGTPAYMAPEQVMAGLSTPQTDLYALGCTLHEVLSGKPVFSGATSYALMNQHVGERPVPLRTVRDDVPAEVEQLVLELLEKKPEDRPASATVVFQRLLPFAASLGPLPGVVNATSTLSPSRMYAGALSRMLAPTHAPGAMVPPRPVAAEPTRIGRGDLNRMRLEASSLARQSRFTQAAEVLMNAARAAGQEFGDIDNDVLGARLELANVRFDGGDYRVAAPEYRRLAADIARQEGADSELALQCRLKEATCHALVGETGLALRQLGALIDDQSRIFGSTDPRTIEVRRQLARLQLGAGDREQATATLRRLHDDLTGMHGPAHASVKEIDTLLSQLAKRPAG